jgi:hypothetical protein
MREVSFESVDICVDALDRFQRKVWLMRCQQDAEVNQVEAERVMLFIDDASFLFLCQNLDGGDTVTSIVLPEEWQPRYAA